jgi:magnesium chelatase subunit I
LPLIVVVEGCRFGCEQPGQCPGPCTGSKAVKQPVPFVDLPLGATEDRLLGALDLERALHRGAGL